MFSIRIGGIEVTCESAVDAAALIAALGERGAARLLPATVDTGARQTESPKKAKPPKAAAPAAAQRNGGGRPATWTEAELRAISTRIVDKGERIDEIAAERGRDYSALYGALRRNGLPYKYVPSNGPPIRRLAPGESGVEDHKGSIRKAG